MSDKPKVIKQKTYKVIVSILDNGKFNIKRICEGFNALELLGILEETKQDIFKQIEGEIRPEQVERQFVKDSLDSEVEKGE